MKIGILGGSFNPAHEGHIKISLEAIDLLGLDKIYWLITKQNPLKYKNEYLRVRLNDNSNIVFPPPDLAGVAQEEQPQLKTLVRI